MAKKKLTAEERREILKAEEALGGRGRKRLDTEVIVKRINKKLAETRRDDQMDLYLRRANEPIETLFGRYILIDETFSYPDPTMPIFKIHGQVVRAFNTPDDLDAFARELEVIKDNEVYLRAGKKNVMF